MWYSLSPEDKIVIKHAREEEGMYEIARERSGGRDEDNKVTEAKKKREGRRGEGKKKFWSNE